jgi:hypothetical protein
MLGNISLGMAKHNRELTVNISFSDGSAIDGFHNTCPYIDSNTFYDISRSPLEDLVITQARQDLRDLVGIVVNGFPSRKKLNIILSVANIRCEDIEILLGLFGSHDSTIRLEEIGTSYKNLYQKEYYRQFPGCNRETVYSSLVEKAVRNRGQEWFLVVSPGSDEIDKNVTAMEDYQETRNWTRRRVWNRVFSSCLVILRPL